MLNAQHESGWLLTETLCKVKSSSVFCPRMAAFVDSYTSHVEKANVLGDGWLESKLMESLCPPVGCW